MFFLVFINLGYSQGVKRALIIAIGNYPASTGWSHLSSLNDVPLVKRLLNTQGFSDWNISVITDSAATKKGILWAFDKLLNECQTGDIVVIHYSGHGQQMEDDNGDEIDGLDEALIPFDANIRYSKEYTGQNHLRDDLIGEYIDKFRKKLGKKGMLNFFADACYSGTINKSIETSRGTNIIFGTPQFVENLKNNKINVIHSGIYSVTSDISTKSDKDNLAGFVLISASMQNQQCFQTFTSDGKEVGSLSYALSKAFSNLKGNETYRSLFDKIFASIVSFSKVKDVPQIPQIEGDVDNKIFSGEIVLSKPYYSIIDYNFYSKDITVNGGDITGLYKNSIIGLFSEDVADPDDKTPVCKGKIIKSDGFSSTIKLDENEIFKMENVDKKTLSQNLESLFKTKLFVLKYGIPEYDLKISFANVDDNIRTNIESKINSIKYIDIDDKVFDYYLTLTNPETGISGTDIYIVSTRNNNKSIGPISSLNISYPDFVAESLKDLFIYKNLRDIEFVDNRYDVSVDIKLAKKNAQLNRFEFIPVEEINGVKTVNLFDTARITIKNSGKNESYLTILNFTPDGKLVQHLPKSNLDRSNLLPVGGEINIGIVNDLIGLETYKIFITKDFIDFSGIINSRGLNNIQNKGTGKTSALEEFLYNSYSGNKSASCTFSKGATNILQIRVVN